MLPGIRRSIQSPNTRDKWPRRRAAGRPIPTNLELEGQRARLRPGPREIATKAHRAFSRRAATFVRKFRKPLERVFVHFSPNALLSRKCEQSLPRTRNKAPSSRELIHDRSDVSEMRARVHAGRPRRRRARSSATAVTADPILCRVKLNCVLSEVKRGSVMVCPPRLTGEPPRRPFQPRRAQKLGPRGHAPTPGRGRPSGPRKRPAAAKPGPKAGPGGSPPPATPPPLPRLPLRLLRGRSPDLDRRRVGRVLQCSQLTWA